MVYINCLQKAVVNEGLIRVVNMTMAAKGYRVKGISVRFGLDSQ